MTLQQMKYVLAVAEKGSFSVAAKALFVSQPSLSNAVKDLEEEIGFVIFLRSNLGVQVTNEGSEFLGYVRQIITQSNLLEDRYLKHNKQKQRFSVSAQHYPFAANAFVDLVRNFGSDDYEFTLRETRTFEVIQDVKNLKSELGLIYLCNYNESVIRKMLHDSSLMFFELFSASPHIFLSRNHPLADKKHISLNDLEAFPCISFEQGENNSFYFSEEILSVRNVRQSIKVSDRAAVVNFLIGLNGYTISSGVYPKYLHDQEIISLPLDANERITVGIIRHRDTIPSPLGTIYMEALRKIAANINS
jgi:DNA-binding transcriptional LysR family regulator